MHYYFTFYRKIRASSFAHLNFRAVLMSNIYDAKIFERINVLHMLKISIYKTLTFTLGKEVVIVLYQFPAIKFSRNF